MSSFIAVLDACVLFPASLRDTLLRTAKAGLYRLQLTDDILMEVYRNLIKKGMPEDKAKRLMDILSTEFEEAFVTQYRKLISSMPINEKDKHVLAAAMACKAQIIVTQNLKDFPPYLLASFDIEAQSPDDFLVHLYRLAPKTMWEIIVGQAGALRNPPKTLLEVLNTLKLHVPNFVNLMLSDIALQGEYSQK